MRIIVTSPNFGTRELNPAAGTDYAPIVPLQRATTTKRVSALPRHRVQCADGM